MKKIFFALAAIAALAACSKSEVAYDSYDEISFRPVTENITKTMVTGTSFPTENFNLWAYYKPVAPGTAVGTWLSNDAEAQTYIDEKPFKHESGIWVGANNPYFWPKNGSLVFVGYYPTAIENQVAHNLATNTLSFYDIPMSKVRTGASDHSEDIMYFNLTPSYATGAVDAEFKHALSWISLILVMDDNTPNSAKITVEKVEFTKVMSAGDAVVIDGGDIKWSTKGNEVTVDILDDNDATTLNSIVLQKGNTTQEPYEPLFIPQRMNGNLVVTYTITSLDGSYFREVKTVALGTLKDASGNTLSTWEPAKHYTYTITIGTSQILVAPKVADWTPVAVNQVI